MKQEKKHAVVSLSGGMDSSTLLLRCLKEFDTVTAISFDYGQKHRVELERAQSAQESANIFNLIMPIPEALRITAGWLGKDTPEQAELEAREQLNLKLYGYKNWYEFCTGEWGTKWDAKTDNDEPFEFDGKQVTVHFDTAWSPPMGIYHALEDMGFDVEATYIEQGMGYIGYYSNGIDKCEEMKQFYAKSGEESNEDDYFPTDAIVDFFEKSGFNHSPSNWGG